MTQYLRFDALQEPFELDLDEKARSVWAFNAIALKRPSTTFTEELLNVLVAAGVGAITSPAKNLFAGMKAVIPEGDGPYTLVIATGGPAPLLTHNEPTLASYQRPTVQITVRASDTRVAKTRIYLAYDAIMAIRNVDVSP